MDQLVVGGALGLLGEGLGVDADRVGESAHAPAVKPHPFAVDHGAQQALRAVAEVARMLLGLEADDVVGAEIGHHLARDGHRLQHRGRHERHVQEEAQRAGKTLLAQHAAERQQVIVVRPHRVVWLQHLSERGGEGLVDGEIAEIVLAAVMHQAEPEMQQRPQRAVGEADIEGTMRLRPRDRPWRR